MRNELPAMCDGQGCAGKCALPDGSFDDVKCLGKCGLLLVEISSKRGQGIRCGASQSANTLFMKVDLSGL